jgi:hypothetical protein
MSFLESNAAPLGRPATIVRDGRDVADERDLEPGGLQRAQRRLTARAGPFTNTEIERMPWSIAFLAASSAASCAANGVDLREPLKPRTPADDHATTLPLTSVMVTMVLLNVDWICAMPL